MVLTGVVSTGLAIGKATGLKLPKILPAIGGNAKKKLKDKIKAQMIELGISDQYISGFSWRNANAGRTLLEFIKANPYAVQEYKRNPIKDIGGDSVNAWISRYKREVKPNVIQASKPNINVQPVSQPPKMAATTKQKRTAQTASNTGFLNSIDWKNPSYIMAAIAIIITVLFLSRQ